MITLNFHGEDAADIRNQMMAMLGVKLAGTTALTPATLPVATTTEVGATEQPKTETPKPLTAAQQKKADKLAADAARNISTGGERTDPAAEKQDAADEAGETAAAKADAPKLTHDNVRTALGEYVKKFGMPAAQEDGPKVLVMLFGEGKAKVSDIPDDQVALAKAVDGIKEMSEKNPFKREPAKAAA